MCLKVGIFYSCLPEIQFFAFTLSSPDAVKTVRDSGNKILDKRNDSSYSDGID